MPVNRDILDALIQHAHGLEAVKQGEADVLINMFNKGIPDLILDIERRMGNITNLNNNARWGYLRQAVNDALNKELDGIKAKLLKDIQKGVSQEVAFQTKAFQGIAPLNTIVTVASPETVGAITARMKVQESTVNALFRRIAKTTESRVLKTIRRGVFDGEDLGTILSNIEGTRENRHVDGLFKKTLADIEAVTRSTNHQVNQLAAEAVFKQNKNLVKGVQMVATLDHRTSAFCINIDGKVYPVGVGPRPPFHFNCRTIAVPVLKHWRAIGIPENPKFDGMPEDRTTYSDWLARQRADVQDTVLGPTRGQLYRDGKVTIDKFTNNRGRLLTLSELAEREGLTPDDFPKI